MIWPKRFKLFECLRDKDDHETYDFTMAKIMQLDGRRVIAASHSHGLAWVPLLDAGEQSVHDLPRVDTPDAPTESDWDGMLIPPTILKEAAKGTKGVGTIELGHPDYLFARSDVGKSTVRVDRRTSSKPFPPFEQAIEMYRQPPPAGSRPVELCLDAGKLFGVGAALGSPDAGAALFGVSQAIGADPGAVRLRFLVDAETGRADGAVHGVIEVTPMEEDGAKGILMMVVSNG